MLQMQITTLTAILLVTTSASCLGNNRNKRFLNLNAPETALGPPVILTFHGGSAVAGLYYRNGRREVSVLSKDGENWNPVGSNGLDVTGVDGNFLSDAVVDAKGQPWILTYYTMPTNAARANRFFLYALKDDRWTIVGPRNGHRANKSGGDQLCILERQTPALFYRAYSPETKKEYHCIYILREGTWTESAVGALLDPRAQIVSRDSMVYVICPGAVDWSIHELKSLDFSKLPIPVHRFTIPGEVTVGEVFVRNKNTFVITIVDKHSSVSFRSFAQVKDGLVVDDIPSPDDNLVISLRWTTDGTICVATNDKRTVRAYLLQSDKTWKLVAEATETTTALIGNCSFAFSTDGKPIVTWETYVRE